MHDNDLMRLIPAVLAGEDPTLTPGLATARFGAGATRQIFQDYFLADIGRYIMAGDSLLHIAAAAYRVAVVTQLLDAGADPRARNRRGSEPLHAAASGAPGAPFWTPDAQVATIKILIDAGADPNAPDKDGVTPLHKAVRTRASAAVEVLLAAGADPLRKSKSGGTPVSLAAYNTGRSGSGSPEAKAGRERIAEILTPWL